MAILIVSCLSLFFIFCYVALLAVFSRGWWHLNTYRPKGIFSSKTQVSIIIAARNEEDKIGKTIDDILAQNYPRHLFELIVVDDHSTDRTAEIVTAYADREVKLIMLNEDQILNSYKKKAIEKAIQSAMGDLIIATDADCRMGPAWVSTIVSFFEEKDLKLISSPVVYFEEKSAFEEMQTLEFLYLIGLGAASIGNKMPSTCNGANLAYRRDVFFEVGGFAGIDDLASGDDELFLHKVASRYPQHIGFCKSEEAIVYTHAKPDVKEFISQRKRWSSKSTRYKNNGIVALWVMIWLANVFLAVNMLLGFFNPAYWLIAAISILLKFIAELIFLIPLTRFAKRTGLLVYLPFLTIAHVFYMIYIGVAGNGGKYLWKGRMVR